MVVATAKKAAAAIGRRFKPKQEEEKIAHRILAVVTLSDGIYHVWSKEPFHKPGKKFEDEFPGFLAKAFEWVGLQDDRCQKPSDTRNAFLQDGENWHPRAVDWSWIFRFKEGLDKFFNYEEFEIAPEAESPFAGKIK